MHVCRHMSACIHVFEHAHVYTLRHICHDDGACEHASIGACTDMRAMSHHDFFSTGRWTGVVPSSVCIRCPVWQIVVQPHGVSMREASLQTCSGLHAGIALWTLDADLDQHGKLAHNRLHVSREDNTRDEGHAPRPAAEAKRPGGGGRHGTSRPLLQSNAGEAEDANRIGRPSPQRQRRGIGSALPALCHWASACAIVSTRCDSPSGQKSTVRGRSTAPSRETTRW